MKYLYLFWEYMEELDLHEWVLHTDMKSFSIMPVKS